MRPSRSAIFAAIVLAMLFRSNAQERIDADHLEKARKDFENPATSTLRCGIKPIQPSLNFGLRLQSGYKVDVPLSQFLGSGHGWVGLIRVTPSGGHPVYLASDGHLPDVPTNNKADGEFTGFFLVGEGSYDVGVLVKDDQGRACRNNWRINAKLTGPERTLAASMPPNTVDAIATPHPAAQPQTAKIPRLTVLLHAAPRRSRAYTMEADDTSMLVDMLSSVMEQLPAREVRMVLFSLEQQRELLRYDDFTSADISHVSDALNHVELGKVDYSVLRNQKGSAAMLSDLVDKELHREHPSDAVVFLGAHSRTSDPIPEPLQPSAASPQFFYLEYRRIQLLRGPMSMGRGRARMVTAQSRAGEDPGSMDMSIRYARIPDSIEQMIGRLKGHTLTLDKPRDFAAAIARVRQSTEPR